jgi:MFS family permease
MSLVSNLGALRERPFRWLYFARANSVFGDGMLPVALAFGVLQTKNSPTALGIVLAFRFLSLVGLMPVSGVIADRLPRRLVLMSSDLLRVGVQAVTGVLLISHAARIWELVGLTFLYGVGDAFFLPTSTGIVPETVSPARLQQANALIGLTQSVCTVIGPVVAGVIVVAIGPGWAFVIDACTFLASAAFVSRLPRASADRRQTRESPAERSSFVGDMRVGWSEFFGRKWLRIEVVYGALAAMVVFAPFETLGPVVARDTLGGAAAWSAIMAAFGAGAILGGLILLRSSPGRPLVASVLMLTLIALAPATLAGPAPTAAVAFGAFAAGAGLSYYNTLVETTIQRMVRIDILSRLAAIDWMFSNSLFPLGTAIAGPLSAVFGMRGIFVVSGAWMVASSAAVLSMKSVRAVQITAADNTAGAGLERPTEAVPKEN